MRILPLLLFINQCSKLQFFLITVPDSSEGLGGWSYTLFTGFLRLVLGITYQCGEERITDPQRCPRSKPQNPWIVYFTWQKDLTDGINLRTWDGKIDLRGQEGLGIGFPASPKIPGPQVWLRNSKINQTGRDLKHQRKTQCGLLADEWVGRLYTFGQLGTIFQRVELPEWQIICPLNRIRDSESDFL